MATVVIQETKTNVTVTGDQTANIVSVGIQGPPGATGTVDGGSFTDTNTDTTLDIDGGSF